MNTRINRSGGKVLNFTGMLVTLLVGGICGLSVYGSSIFAAVVLLSLAQLVCFMSFTLFEAQSRSRLLALFWIEAGLIASLFVLVSVSVVAILSMVWVVQAVELYGPKLGAWLMGACLSFFIATQFYHFGTDNLLDIGISMAIYGLLLVFAVGMTQRMIEERRLREDTAALNRELIATRELLSQTSAQSERLRIARDLHDILGHHMTALILNLEVASHSVEGKPLEKVEQSLALAKLLLSDLRSTVSELREDSAIDLNQSIQTLVRGIPNLEFDIDFTGAPTINNVELAETLLRCTQEAITNVIRHSSASHCRIAVTGNGGHCILSVADNGPAKSKGYEDVQPGNGLKGMAERVKASGGELSWQRSAEGFQLQVTLAAGTSA